MDPSQISRRTISTAALFLIAIGAVLLPANVAAGPNDSGINVLKNLSGTKASDANHGNVQRASEIRQAEDLRGDLRKTTGIAPLRLQRLDAALAVIAAPTATTAELQAAEAELDAFVATQQTRSPSREAPANAEKPASSMQKKLDDVDNAIASKL